MAKDDSLLIAAIEQAEGQSTLYAEVSKERIEALDRYLGEPLGNEVEGRSQVVSRDTFETIEWIKPDLAEIFCGGDEVVAFQPRGPEDEKGAEQETDYVNQIITQRNEWFSIWLGWSHDALLQKTGYVKAYWDDSEDEVKERYENISEAEYQYLMQDDGVECIEDETSQVLGPVDPQTGMPTIEVLHSCVMQRKGSVDVVKLVNLAPENVRVSQHARNLSLQDPALDFCEHEEWKTITQLRQDGFDVDDDIADSGPDPGTYEQNLRDKYQPFQNSEGDEADPSMRRVRVREVWIRYDYDGDGKAELRHVIIVGTTILENDECEFVPIVALCPNPLPHQHYGLSVADAVMDLEKIKTALMRSGLDNEYLALNGRYAVDPDNVNLDDMLDSRPGGIVRVQGQPGMSILPLTHPTRGDAVIPMMEYVDANIAKRTGVNENSQGLDSSSINKNAPYATTAALMTAAQKRVRFIARIFAEMGVRPLFQIVHALTLKHARKAEIVKLRNTWVPVDPRQWVKRQDMQISVGLGAGDKAQQIMFLDQTLQKQMGLMPMGLASPQNVFNTLQRYTRAAGYKDAKEFWSNPAEQPPRPQQPPPEVQVEQMRQQGKQQEVQAKTQAQLQIESMKGQQADRQAQLDAQVQQANKQAELQVQAENDRRDSERQMLEAHLQRQADQQAQAFEVMLARMEDERQRYEADLDARVRLTIAGMQDERASESAHLNAQAKVQQQRPGVGE